VLHAVQRPLHAAHAARRWVSDWVRARPFVTLGAAGFVVTTVIVVAGGRIGPVRTTIPLTGWVGLLSRNGERPGDYWASSIMLAGLIGLVMLWLVAVRINRPQRCTEATVWWLAAAWGTPFVLGPPLLSNDVYSYAAQGLMARRGFDPYAYGPAILGNTKALAAVDPSWRSVTSPYGPLAGVIEHLAVAISGGSALGAVIVFRALAVGSAIAIGLLAADLAGPRRVQALTMTVLNPLLLVHVVSAAHLEGIMCAFLLGSLVAASKRHWALAIVLGAAAGAIKAPGYLAMIAVVVVHGFDRPGHVAWRLLARDTALAAACLAGSTLLVPNGLGWLNGLNTPSLGHTPWAPASILSSLLTPLVPSASFDDLAAAGRITTTLVAVCIVIYLLATARDRSLNRTVGYGLLALALSGPVVYPWYMLWGILCLVPTARVARLDWLVLASGLFCVIAPPGFGSNTTVIFATIEVMIALAMISPRVLARRRAARTGIQAASV